MRQIDEFKNERALLRQTLDTFRRDFERTNARKIKFKKDIRVVDNEFKRYKDLKEDIARLEKEAQKYASQLGNVTGAAATVL